MMIKDTTLTFNDIDLAKVKYFYQIKGQMLM